jgi:hypothetical protein
MSAGDAAGQELVPNRYLEAVRECRDRSVGPAGEFGSALTRVVAAMDASAWISTAADRFYEVLTGQQRVLVLVGERSLAQFDEALAGLPEEVSRTSWYCHWDRGGIS